MPRGKPIDPASIAEEAIKGFIEAVCREMPWTGLRDISQPTISRFTGEAVSELVQGLAVTDDEISPDAG